MWETPTVTRDELLFTAWLLRAQVRRLRSAALQADGEAYRCDIADANDLERRAEQMEKEAAALARETDHDA